MSIRNLRDKKIRALIISFVFCLLSTVLFSQEPPEVDGIFKDGISINRGSDDGVYAGAEGRVYYMRKYGEKEIPIYIAKFRVESVEKKSCRAKILETTGEPKIGHNVIFDSPLKTTKD